MTHLCKKFEIRMKRGSYPISIITGFMIGLFIFSGCTKDNNEDRITWQPKKGVRNAIVVRSYHVTVSTSTGYIMAGRSLREVENRVSVIGRYAMLAWMGLVAFSFLTTIAAAYIEKKKTA